MEAYIEFVILDNFMITWLIGAAACRFLHIKSSKMRLLLCSAAGTAAAVGYPFLNLHPLWLILLKIALGAALSAVLFAKRCKYITGFCVFMVLTFMFGGLLFCVSLMRYGDVQKAMTEPVSGVPVGVLLLAGVLLYALCRKLFTGFHRRRDAQSGVMDIQIEVFGETLNAKGFLDTGNRLYDGATGLPVVILGVKALLPLLTDEQMTEVFGGNVQAVFPGSHYITCSSLGKAGQKLLVFRPDKFRFYKRDKTNILKDVMVGLSFSKITDAVAYDAILHPAILES